MEHYVLNRGAYKNLTLRLRPDGSLRVSAPWFVPRRLVDQFVAERAGWIAERRGALGASPTADGSLETASFWGLPQRVRIESPGRLPRVVHDPTLGEVVLRVPAAWGPEKHRKLLEDWEKARVTEALATLVPLWTGRMGLRVDRWAVKRLRSRWGSCQPTTRSLVFNARLGALPFVCLEHVVVHELVHLIELSHNARFHALVERWLPGSKEVRALLKKGIGPAGTDVSLEPPAKPEEGTVP